MAVISQTNMNNIQAQVTKSTQETMAEIGRTTKQVHTGKIGDDFKDIASRGTIRDYVRTKDSLYKHTAFNLSNKNLQKKLDQMQNAILSVFGDPTKPGESRGMIKDVKVYMVRAAQNNSVLNVTGDADNFLASLKTLLNTTHNGQFLFAGTKDNIAPVGDIVTNSNIDVSSVVSSNYYNGNHEKLAEQVSSDDKMEYGVTAAHSGFQKLIAGLHKLKQFGSTGDRFDLQEAQTLVEDARGEIGRVVSQLSSDMQKVDELVNRTEREKLTYTQQIADYEDADASEFFTEIEMQQLKFGMNAKILGIITKMNFLNYM